GQDGQGDDAAQGLQGRGLHHRRLETARAPEPDRRGQGEADDAEAAADRHESESRSQVHRRRWACAAVQEGGAIMRRLIWVLGLMLCAAAPARAAGRDDAKRHFAAGEARFKAGDYRGAIAEFKAADAIVPSPILAYNEALCYDRLGDAEK